MPEYNSPHYSNEEERLEYVKWVMAEAAKAPKGEWSDQMLDKMAFPIGVYGEDDSPVFELEIDKEFTDQQVLTLKEIIESVYTDGIDSLSDLKRGDKKITGIFTDGSDRFEFELISGQISYSLIY